MAAAHRKALRVALYCSHPACSEEVTAIATRESERFTVTVPRGWARVREELVNPDAPRLMPALCPAHRPDPRAFVARSIGEIAQSIAATKRGKQMRELRGRLERYARMVDGWKTVEPSEEQLTAMADVVAEMREEVGLPPGLTSGVVSRRK